MRMTIAISILVKQEHTLKAADWNNSTIIKANVVEEIAELKQQPGNHIGITGSATLVQSLMQTNLINGYRLFIHPIIVGRGKRLFRDGMDTQELALIQTKTYPSGAMLLTYQSV